MSLSSGMISHPTALVIHHSPDCPEQHCQGVHVAIEWPGGCLLRWVGVRSQLWRLAWGGSLSQACIALLSGPNSGLPLGQRII